jgi:2-polyprenyl-3-methyl-5-hydroxy-6-metoxy-1,4-benzoquinol methylase
MDLREQRADGTDEAGARRHPWEVARSRFFRGVIADHVDRAAVTRVLDVGAGDGWFAHELLPDLPEQAQVVCWDINYRSSDLAVPAGERISRTARRPDGPFDLVLLLDVIEHVEDDDAFLADDVVPLLAAGARAVVSVPAYPSLYCEHDRMLEHHRRYRPADLRALLARHLRIVASGSLFTTLLAPRAVTVVMERAGRRHEARGVGGWDGGAVLTTALTGVLDADAAVGRRLARQRLVPGARLPGLSTWAVVAP